MRTTLDLDPTVLAELRQRGERERKSMGQVASELLAGAMSHSEPPAPPFVWRTGHLGVPKIDLEDKEALNAALDGRA